MTLCNKHYIELSRHGKIKNFNSRSQQDLNEIVIYDDYAEIVLYNRKSEETNRTKIDIEDIDKVKNHKWRIDGNGYVGTHFDNRELRLHRLIMNNPQGLTVDHISRDKLDNRKNNLRICTQHENSFNKGIRRNNSSGVTGVCWDKNNNKWMAHIQINGKNKTIGRYENIEDAIEARKEAEEKYFGEFRCQNVN